MILAVLQTVVVYIVNFWLYKNKLHFGTSTVIGAVIAFNIASALPGGFTPSQDVSPGILVVWCIVFMVNALAAGLANNLLEAFFIASREDPRGGRTAHVGWL
jgi:hypothetical protein